MVKLMSMVIACLFVALPSVASGAPYTPVSQTLQSCQGKTLFDSGVCFGYIMATLEASTADRRDKGNNDYLSISDMSANELIERVVSYLKIIPLEEASSPSGPMILRALRRNPLSKSDS